MFYRVSLTLFGMMTMMTHLWSCMKRGIAFAFIVIIGCSSALMDCEFATMGSNELGIPKDF